VFRGDINDVNASFDFFRNLTPEQLIKILGEKNYQSSFDFSTSSWIASQKAVEKPKSVLGTRKTLENLPEENPQKIARTSVLDSDIKKPVIGPTLFPKSPPPPAEHSSKEHYPYLHHDSASKMIDLNDIFLSDDDEKNQKQP